MGWYVGQLGFLLLASFLLGVLAGYLWFVLGYKKHKTTRSVSETTELRGLVDGLRTERDQTSKALRDAQAEFEAARGQLVELRSEHDTALSELVSVRAKADGQGSEVRRLVGQVQDLEKAQGVVIDLRSEAEQARGELEALRMRADTAEADVERLRAQLETPTRSTPRGLMGSSAGDGVGTEGSALHNLEPATSSAADGDTIVAHEQQDDELERVEGIGPRIAGALRAAGIRSFAQLARSDEGDLRRALKDADLRFAPSLPTWATQADYLVRGDETGFLAYTGRLVAGREPGAHGASS